MSTQEQPKRYSGMAELEREFPKFFSAESRRLFKQRTDHTLFSGPGGQFFVCSVCYKDHTGWGPRVYTVREVRDNDILFFVGNLPTLNRARAVATGMASGIVPTYASIDEIKAANKAIGKHWFSSGAMSSFNTYVYPDVYGGKYFIYRNQYAPGCPYEYKVAECIYGNINTVSEKFATYEQCTELANELVKHAGK